jgi:hypothetical protein
MKRIAAVTLALSTLLLAACSKAPGDADLQQALRQSMQSIGGPAAASPFDAQIKQTKVLDCHKEQGVAYRCDIIGLFGLAQSVRMIKSDNGWVVVQ